MSLKLGRTRKLMTPYQEQILMKKFQEEAHLDKEGKNQLAMSLNISQKKCADWFLHMRRKELSKEKILETRE